MDIFPTLCDLLDIERPPWLQGVSMMPLIRGEAKSVRDQIFAEVSYHASYEPQRSVRTKRWKYIRRFEGRARPVLPNCDDSPSKTLWMEHGWANRRPASETLYDLIFDPNETANLVSQPEAADVLHDMRERLEQWMRETDDPLLKGKVPAPAGAVANDPDGVSPGEPRYPVGE